MRFRASQRLRRTAEFEVVRSSGRRADCGPFILQGLTGPEDAHPLRRLGVIASKRVGNAVRRNRSKRLLRELFRLNQERLPENCDLVAVAKRSMADCAFDQLNERWLKGIERVFDKGR